MDKKVIAYDHSPTAVVTITIVTNLVTVVTTLPNTSVTMAKFTEITQNLIEY